MKKYKNITSLVIGCAFAASTQPLYAGAMGKSTNVSYMTPFVSIEGSASWIMPEDVSITNLSNLSSLNSLELPQNIHPWGGRIAVGTAYHYKPHLDFIAEGGWDYFGNSSHLAFIQDMNMNITLTGFDMMVGAVYKMNAFSWFGEVGALNERASYRSEAYNIALTDIAGTPINYSGTIKTTLIDVLPIIKIGAMYNFSPQLSLTGAYLHSFGGNPGITGSMVPIGPGITTANVNMNVDLNAPSINSVLIGLRYNFV